ncbi:MAG: DUF4982 domain-containing protein [Clostridia bacterium]|nr:DUF4982 domain-containing protein [Clostridia bacterium]
MFLRRGLSALIAVSILALHTVGALAYTAAITVKGQGTDTMDIQKQDDFVYTESFENHDDTEHRMRVNIDYNWRFMQKDVAGAEAKGFNDSSWRLLNLPHDWSIEGEYDQANSTGGACGFLPAGIGWYRKTLVIPAEYRDGKQVSLYFDGVFCNSTVYVDGEKVGESFYGWLSFSCDITAQVQGKESVEIAVRVDNSIQPSARWYTGSGIYSHVWLISTDDVHVAENGTYVITPAAGIKQAPDGTVKIETVVDNDGAADSSIKVRSSIINKKNGQLVAQIISEAVTVAAGASVTVNQETKVDNPLLWSSDDPNLYTLKTEIISGNEVVDDYLTDFGFRSIYYEESGFYVNGVKTKLKGVANHWAIGALGAAQSDNMIRYAVQILKDMGVNAIRTAHNARPPVFYQICNELGMMVMDELFEGATGKASGDYGTLYYQSRWKTDMEYWLRRDRNHPSIVFWSLGNETREGDNGMTAFLKQFDTTRPTTGGDIFQVVDIPGGNGSSEQVTFRQPVAGKPMVATEAPHSHAVRGVYRTQTWYRGYVFTGSIWWPIPNLTEKEIFEYDWADFENSQRIWPSSYDNASSQISVRKNWELTRDTDWRIGEFRWTGFDYLGEANYVLGGWPYRMFHSGAIDVAYFPKDMYYLYQSMWLDTPMLHVLPSWTHPIMEEGTEIPVWVYSNCEEVELFFRADGTDEYVSLGRLDHGPMSERLEAEMQFEWLVPWKPGTIKAIGYDNNGNAILEESHTTASSPAGIKLENTTGEELPVDPSWIGQVTVSILDKDGNLYPYGENRTYYHVSGPAFVKALENGSPTDTESHVMGNRNAFMGLAKAFVQPTQDDGDVILTVGAILGEKRQLTSDLVYIDVEQLALRGDPSKDEFEIFYTTDGTAPSRSSTPYTGAFSVELGTTVKAAVYFKGETSAIFVMEETFGENEGMFWSITDRKTADNVATIDNAVLTGDGMTTKTYGYGETYANFNNKPGSVTYTLNAEKAGTYYVAICYNNGSYEATSGTPIVKWMDISVNGTFVKNYGFPYNGDWDIMWSYAFIKVNLNEGENTIKIDSPRTSGANLKEIIYWHDDDIYTADNAEVTGDDSVLSYETAPDGIGVDVHQGGTVSWEITDRPAGKYTIKMVYSTPNPSTHLTQFYGIVNGEQKAVWMTNKVSNDYGSSWGLYSAEVELAPGTNTVSMRIPNGGALVSALIIEPISVYDVTTVTLNSASLSGIKIGVENNSTPAITSDEYLSDYTTWDMVRTSSGAFYLVCRANGKLLGSGLKNLYLTSETNDRNTLWITRGEMENYDFIQHVYSERVLAISPENVLILDYADNYYIGDRDSRALWTIREAEIDFAFDESTPKTVTADKKPFKVLAKSLTSSGTVTYSIVSGPATIDTNTGLLTLTGELGTVIIEATLDPDGDESGARASFIMEVTGSEVARQPGTQYSALDATYPSGFKSGTTDSGIGYVDFNNKTGSIDFEVTVPYDGEYYIAVRYNCANTRYFNLTVNGVDSGRYTCPMTGSTWYGDWSYQMVKATLNKGVNTIGVSNAYANSPVVSEIIVYPTSEWHLPSDVESFEGGSVVVKDAYNTFNKEHIDFGQKGAVSWNINVPTAGKYKLIVTYSTGAAWTPRLNAYADGKAVGNWTVKATGTNYGDSLDFLTTGTFMLTEGIHTFKLEAPSGGTFVDSIRLELVKEYNLPTSGVDVYSPHDAVYPSGFKAGTTPDGVEYVDFNNKTGTIDYTVNVERAGEYYVAVAYNTANERRFELIVNGKSYGAYVCPATGTAWYGNWSYQIIKVTLNAGDNTVSVGRYLTYAPVVAAELRVSSVHEWWLPSDADSFSGGAVVNKDTYYNFNGEHIDFGQNGSATWNVSVPYNGSYRLIFTYSSGTTWNPPIKAYADGKLVKQWNVVPTGGYGTASGFVTSPEFYLSAGEHTITYEVPQGGAFGDAIRIELVNECKEHIFNGDAICDNCTYVCSHTGGEATCNAPANCTVCGTAYGAVNTDNHVDKNGKYTYNDDGTHSFDRTCCEYSDVQSESCEFGDDNVCDHCGHDRAPEIAQDNFDKAFAVLFEEGEGTDLDVKGPGEGALDAYEAKKSDDVLDGFKYKQFNLRLENKIVTLRHHIKLVDAESFTLLVDGKDVVLINYEGTDYYYFETTADMGKLHHAHVITVSDGTTTVTVEISVYSYIKIALDNNIKDEERTVLKALYDLNEATRID